VARIIGGIGTSHVPNIAAAFDQGKESDPFWMVRAGADSGVSNSALVAHVRGASLKAFLETRRVPGSEMT
jgi:hypothetical protein